MANLFDPLFNVMTWLLAWFYDLWPSYGMAIIFLTLIAMTVVTPLTMKGTRSMLQMQLLAPELKKIQQKHRGDRQAMNEASMEFYKEHGMNPLGGCLPLLVQAPLFLVIYQVVRGLTRRATDIGTQLGFTVQRYANGAGGGSRDYMATPVVGRDLDFDPDFVSHSSELYKSLSGKTEMVSWGVDLSRTAGDAMSEGIVTALPYLFMMLLVLITGLFQQHQIQRRQSSAAAINPTQQTIMKLIPYFLPIISYTIPAAVVVYFIISALFRIGQQGYITRSLYSKEGSLGAQVAQQRKSGDKSDDSPKELGKGQKELGKGSSSSSTKSTRPKAPKRGGGSPHAAAPSRGQSSKGQPSGGQPSKGQQGAKRASSAGRSGKAPSRGRAPSGRTTTSGTKAKHSVPNRSKNKRKRR